MHHEVPTKTKGNQRQLPRISDIKATYSPISPKGTSIKPEPKQDSPAEHGQESKNRSIDWLC